VNGSAHVVAISNFTKRKLRDWAALSDERVSVVPCPVDMTRFTPGEKDPRLIAYYGLGDRRILLTVARLSASERYKGVDEVLSALPAVLSRMPSAHYLVVGEGDDRKRLEGCAADLGVRDNVTFTGHIDEHEKVAHYQLADVFVMPGSGEGFGIVYLEALACGVPVVASVADASQEIVRHPSFGAVADPADVAAIADTIVALLRHPPAIDREALRYFDTAVFAHRIRSVLRSTLVRLAR
jgi:phosphatidyl-myo-inositol dimannoside synthase